MNLIGDPWVPVVFANGESRLASLNEVFRQSSEILDLVATPPQRIALMRLFVCISQAALDGPANEEDWRGCRGRIAPAALRYLEHWKDRFDLFGENAFLQLPNLETTDNAVLDKLDFGQSAGNNAVLFDHSASPGGRMQSAAWSALMLLMYQCFSPGGTIGVSTWNGTTTSGNSEHAPCLEGSMLHTILRGPSLLDSIHMNLLTKDSFQCTENDRWGTPVWEQMPQGPIDPRVAEIATQYLGRLVPVSRGIKLRQGKATATLVNGCSYPKLPHREPAASVVRRGKDERLAYIAIELAKHPWRELGAILTFSRTADEGGPLVIKHLQPGPGKIDFWTGGIAANKGKIIDTAEWSFSIPLSLLGDSALSKYRKGAEFAEKASWRIQQAITAYYAELAVSEFKRNDLKSRQHQRKIVAHATTVYWRTLDAAYNILINTANDEFEELSGQWGSVVRDAMEKAYELACPHQNARQIQAFVLGKRKLWLNLHQQSGSVEVSG